MTTCIRHGRVGLSPAAWELWELVSRERRRLGNRWLFQSPIGRVCRECGDITHGKLNALLAELTTAGLADYGWLLPDGTLFVWVVRPSRSGRRINQ